MQYNLTELERTDTTEKLSLYSYRACDNTSPESLKACRGLVVENETGKILWGSNGYVDEYVEECPQNVHDYNAYLALEGTSLRLFYYNNEWILCTHRKLDAFSSRWGSSKSFGDLFVDALANTYNLNYNTLVESLCKDHMYTFFLQAGQSNRLVCKPTSSPTVYIVTTHSSGGIVGNTIPVIKEQEKLAVEVTPESITTLVKTLDPQYHPGILLRNGTHEIKIVSKKYKDLLLVRGNESSLAWRYLQVRNDYKMYKPFLDLYVERSSLFNKIEDKIKRSAHRLSDLYIDRYENGKYDFLPPLQHYLLKRVRNNIRRTGDDEIENVLYRYFLYELSNMDTGLLNSIVGVHDNLDRVVNY